jgi:diacylglycerol kinase (ATP)
VRGARGFDGLIAVGGDGTVFAVVNCMDLERQTLAIIPTGTGNSLARDYGVKTLETAVSRARTETPRAVDLVELDFCDTNGKREQLYCTSTSAVGYTAAITETANRRFKSLGPLCYPVASLVCALRVPRTSMRISYDGKEPVCKRLTGVMIQNARHAANFELFPDASTSDGLLDFLETDAGFAGQVLHVASVLSRLRFYRPAGIGRAASIRIELETPQLLMVDGEVPARVSSVTAHVVPGRLKCCL